jgi:hypothetical protein
VADADEIFLIDQQFQEEAPPPKPAPPRKKVVKKKVKKKVIEKGPNLPEKLGGSKR